MRIVCPACEAAYEVPEPLLDTKRPVRCARCGHEWRPWTPPDPAPDAAPDAATPPVLEPWTPAEPNFAATVLEVPTGTVPSTPAFETQRVRPGSYQDEFLAPNPDERLSPEASRGNGFAIRLAWAATVLLIALLAWGGYAWRGDVMRLWPASERLYATLGLVHAEP